MTDEDMRDCYLGYVRVSVVNHDYIFEGVIVSIFRKYANDEDMIGDASGPWRCVVQSRENICLIQSAKNLIVAS